MKFNQEFKYNMQLILILIALVTVMFGGMYLKVMDYI